MTASQNDSKDLVDGLSLRIIEELIRNPAATYKEIAASLKHDQRTVARRISELEKAGIVKPKIEIEWKALGMEVSAYVGLTTARSPRASAELHEYIKTDPRIVEAYETIGSHQFYIRVLGNDIYNVRDSILRDLDPLAGDLTTSLVTAVIKAQDYLSLVRHLRETKYPRTRSASQ